MNEESNEKIVFPFENININMNSFLIITFSCISMRMISEKSIKENEGIKIYFRVVKVLHVVKIADITYFVIDYLYYSRQLPWCSQHFSRATW